MSLFQGAGSASVAFQDFPTETTTDSVETTKTTTTSALRTRGSKISFVFHI